MAKEYIEREAIRNLLYDEDAITMHGMMLLTTFHAADVVEVVRCKDCKHYKAYSRQCEHPDGLYLTVAAEDGYCCYGERK